MPEDNQIIPWHSLSPARIPPGEKDASVMVRDYAVALRKIDKDAISTAFEKGFFAMGAGHLWRRAMSRVRLRLGKLGLPFLAEMLDRSEIGLGGSADTALTDADTIHLAEALGFVDLTGARRLRTAFDTVVHFDSETATEEMSIQEASSICRACVQYVLARDEDGLELDFIRFRDRLLGSALLANDPALQQLLSSPPFFVRTALRALIAAIKQEDGAKMDHALANLNTIVSSIWSALTDEDKWSLGLTFAELSANGSKPQAIAGLRKALLSVQGFDYVPENLRSNTFKRAAQAVLTAHFNFNNFYNEPDPVRQLAAMGSVIPAPAIGDCLKAYLCVYLGNSYGRSWDAAATAKQELVKTSSARWEIYLTKMLPTQEEILHKLTDSKCATIWMSLAQELNLASLSGLSGLVKSLVEASLSKNMSVLNHNAKQLLTNFRGKITVGE